MTFCVSINEQIIFTKKYQYKKELLHFVDWDYLSWYAMVLVLHVNNICMIRTMALAIFQIFFSCFYAPYFNNSKYLFVCNSIQDKHQVRIISYRENSSLCNSLSLSIFVVGIHFKLRNSSHFFMYIFNKQLQKKRYVICVWHYLVKYMILLDSWTRICVNNWCCALQVILYHLKLCYSLPLFLFNSLNGQDCMCLLYSLFIHYIIWHYNHVLHFFLFQN